MPSISETSDRLVDLITRRLNLSASEAKAESQLILSKLTGLSNAEVLSKKSIELNNQQLQAIKQILARRFTLEPLQYILGEAYFYGGVFKVNQNVLIPRPETELLVEKALKVLKNIKEPKILEIGCGSGCISVTLAKYLQKQKPKIFATDIEGGAIEISRSNAKSQNVNQFINFTLADLVSNKLKKESFDLVISNPPYISATEYQTLQKEVLKEPRLALVGNKAEDGLAYYKEIAALKLKTTRLLLELDPGRAKQIQKIFEATGCKKTELLKDYSGNIRFIHVINP